LTAETKQSFSSLLLAPRIDSCRVTLSRDSPPKTGGKLSKEVANAVRSFRHCVKRNTDLNMKLALHSLCFLTLIENGNMRWTWFHP